VVVKLVVCKYVLVVINIKVSATVLLSNPVLDLILQNNMQSIYAEFM